MLSESDLAAILAAWEKPSDHPEIARVVDVAEIRENAHNLSIPLYVTATSEGDVEGRLEAAVEAWQGSRDSLRDQTASLLKSLESIGIQPETAPKK